MRGRTTNVLMAGVGGQGVLLASETLALAALESGALAKQSEVHGVAQRGGGVVSHVRYAAERLEALRHSHTVRAGGVVVMDDRAIPPLQLPDEPPRPYPEGVPGFLRGKGLDVIVVDAIGAALALGEKRCANVVLLGALASRLDIGDDCWQRALESRFPAKILDLNRRAFERGRELAAVTSTS